MTEAQIGLLYKYAANMSNSENNTNNLLLKSYYLMRCKDITRGYGLPDKHFSTKIRCPNCCIEWTKINEIKMSSIKLSKRQKKRLKSKEITCNKKEYIRRRKDLLFSNEMKQICTFCRKGTITSVLKPQKVSIESSIMDTEIVPLETTTKKIKQKNNNLKIKGTEINVYAKASDIFSLQNKNNTLPSTLKEKPKPINNNKKKKDKFAGLCQKAVLASAKLKEKNNKQNRLNLFLKPSST